MSDLKDGPSVSLSLSEQKQAVRDAEFSLSNRYTFRLAHPFAWKYDAGKTKAGSEKVNAADRLRKNADGGAYLKPRSGLCALALSFKPQSSIRKISFGVILGSVSSEAGGKKCCFRHAVFSPAPYTRTPGVFGPPASVRGRGRCILA